MSEENVSYSSRSSGLGGCSHSLLCPRVARPGRLLVAGMFPKPGPLSFLAERFCSCDEIESFWLVIKLL